MAWHCVQERISRPAGVADGSTDADVGDGKQWTRNVTVRAFRRQLRVAVAVTRPGSAHVLASQ